MGIMIFMLKSQRRAFRWPNNLRARLYIYQKPKSLVVCEGRPDFSFLFKSCEIDKSQGRLV